MSIRIDFKIFRRDIPIMEICMLLGLQLKKTGVKYSGKCPICQRNAFKVTPSKNLFWCFGECQDGGDGLALYSQVMKLSVLEAAEQVYRRLGRS